jgi:hypothetical protein
LGGTAGFAEFSMPPNKMLALTRDPHCIGIARGGHALPRANCPGTSFASSLPLILVKQF